MSTPFFPEGDSMEYAPRGFAATHKKKIIGLVALVVLIAVALGVAVPLAKRGGSNAVGAAAADDEDATAKAGATVAATTTAGTTVAVTVSATTNATTLPPKTDVTALALQADGACLYAPDGATLAMDAKVPVWPVGDESVWRTDEDGVTFKPAEWDPNFVWKAADHAPRVYPFRVAVPGRYFVSLLSTAHDRTEFNDCWLSFPFGGGLEFYDVLTHEKKAGGTGFYKAYQNDYAYKVGIYHVDHVPHHFATVDELVPGVDYSILVAGRASQFTVHRILLTQCAGDACGGNAAVQATLDAAAYGPVTPCNAPAL